MAKSEAELMQQFNDLVADMRQLADDLLKQKDPDRARYINQVLTYLVVTVRQDPVQAKAVLYCADAMWNLLLVDAGRGVRQRHLDGLPPPNELETKEYLKELVYKTRKKYPIKKYPSKNITWVREEVAKKTGYSGAKAVARKTGWYNPK